MSMFLIFHNIDGEAYKVRYCLKSQLQLSQYNKIDVEYMGMNIVQ